MSNNKIFERAFEKTVGIEGGYVDHPADRGGPTRFGITEETARAHGFEGDMRELPIEKAKEIYFESYFSTKRLPLDQVSQWSEALAEELFDTAVNMGVESAAKMFQLALNALNLDYASGAPFFADLTVDGWAGQSTLGAMWTLGRTIDKRAVVRACDAMQGARYVALALDGGAQSDALHGLVCGVRHAKSQRAFTRGWLEHRVRNVEKGG